MARREELHSFCDLSNVEVKRNLISIIGRLSDWWEVRITPRRNRRSLQANSFYWAAIVTPFYQFLRDQDGDVSTVEDAHNILRDKFLKVPVFNKRTGDLIGERVRSTTELDVEEFARYCDECIAWLADFFKIVVNEMGRPQKTVGAV